MTGALVRIEARHLARSPLLLMGVALGVAAGALELSWYLPALAGDDLIAYRDVGLLLSGGAVLAGAWLGLRDRATGAADLLAVTPTAPWRLWTARLGGVAAAAAGVFAALFAATLAVSAVRGGRGLPDPRLLGDGALGVVLGGWVGLAVGRLSGSRMVSVLAAPLWVGLFFVGQDNRLALSVQNLSRVLKGWQEDGDPGTEKRAWRWMLEGDTDAHHRDDPADVADAAHHAEIIEETAVDHGRLAAGLAR